MFIYETCAVLNDSVNEAAVDQVISQVTEVIKKGDGEILLTDQWGVRTLAQPTVRGIKRGYYLYLMYSADGNVNKEIERRYRINELVLKHIILKKGTIDEKELLLKSYITPYASNSAHHPPRQQEEIILGERERISPPRRNGKNAQAADVKIDWKNPQTYKWLVNDFGKISPARVTGLSSAYQRRATTEIKRARNMGLISHVNRNLAP